MFGFGGNQNQQQYQNPVCSCGRQMTFCGEHGIRMGGVTGIKGAALDFIGGNTGQEINEVFEKKLMTEIFVCDGCGDVRLKYVSGF